jgi:SAM-dependent methyltransferase
MRASREPRWSALATSSGGGSLVEDLGYDEKTFFESFYRSGIRGQPADRMTIGQITDWESRFHYNCVENAIISAVARRSPPPPSMMVETWRMLQKRRSYRLLDVGSGTGHWIDFFRQVFLIGQAVGVEITESMSTYLREKYADCPDVKIVQTDIADNRLDGAFEGDRFDYISAIGVMFHLVEDSRCQTALAHFAELVGDEGLIFITGDFGASTRNVQFHKYDEFQTWNAQQQSDTSGGTRRVNKRLRSLAQWHQMAWSVNLRIVDLVRTPRDPVLTTPENDLLVLAR